MRAVIFVIILILLALIVALATGLVRLGSGVEPTTGALANSSEAAPFAVETGSVHAGGTPPVKQPDNRVSPLSAPASNLTAVNRD